MIASSSLRTAALRAGSVLQVLAYAAWALCLAAGTRAYEGEPIRVHSADLPLHTFDKFFRRAGGLLVPALWAARAVASAALRLPGDRRIATVLVPGALHAVQARPSFPSLIRYPCCCIVIRGTDMGDQLPAIVSTPPAPASPLPECPLIRNHTPIAGCPPHPLVPSPRCRLDLLSCPLDRPHFLSTRGRTAPAPRYERPHLAGRHCSGRVRM
jgi:hypothetical protein